MRGLVLAGFMGVGKSTVGAILAARRAVPFVDTDAVLVERFGPIADQFANEGEPIFREREAAVVHELCAGPPAVLATGGGVWPDADLRRALRAWGHGVVLHAERHTLASRLAGDASRPLAARAERLLDQRAWAYQQGDAAFRVDGVSPAQVADRIEQWWRERES